MYSCILRIIIIFLMSTNSFIYLFNLLPPWGGCPSPWACGAYPRAGHGWGAVAISSIPDSVLFARKRAQFPQFFELLVFLL
jgi:hypothetical protein